MTPECLIAARRIPALGQTLFSTDRFSEARAYAETVTRPYQIVSHALKSGLVLSHEQRATDHITFDMVTVECSGRFEVAAPQISDRYLCQFNIYGDCQVDTGDGQMLAPAGSMFVINPDQASRKVWSNGCRQLMVWINRAALHHALEKELGFNIDRPIVFSWPTMDQGALIAPFWLRMANLLGQLQAADTGPLHWRTARQVEHLIMLDLLATLPNNYSEDVDRADNSVAPYYVRRVERYLQANLNQVIHMDDIYRVAGVSPRALFYGFRQFRHTTPMAMLKKMRLDTARKALLQAAGTGGSVTDTAMNCGFQNLSMFSREYRARFGEAPSETLRRGIN